ncbi:putative bifunctional diguanylate cyclase/phosphodiesterase [Clostridium rectalis]|uniref:putative bifunctional diguanylate cyclase/phosphodiesterase n=1 Tax=Clostridium rectalis TaxID=2040295 RepID=UPI000F62F6F4|nr:GGDEF domain-containing phosphodiesterase [Clostridium rectalis]
MGRYLYNGVKMNSPIYQELAATEEDIKSQYEELRKNQKALKISEERYRLAVEGANDALWDWDFINNKFFISDKWKEEMGYISNSNLSIIGRITRMLHCDDVNLAMDALKEYLKGNKPYYMCEFRMKYKEDGYRWVLSRGKLLRDEKGVAIRMAGSLSDITDRKIYEEKIKKMAYFDRLTNLPNFHYFQENMNTKIEKNKEYFNFALLLIDIDNFRNINDTLGHKFGDKVLKEVSNRLKKFLDVDDNIYRTGEDEFLLVKSCIGNKKNASDFAESILEYFRNCIVVDKHEVYTNVSIGIGIYPQDGDDVFTLFKNVDSAMYSAKEHGKNRYEFFDEDIYNRILQRSYLEINLRRAVEKNEFILYYQPQMNLKTESIIGVEALIRWSHPKEGLIPPGNFIPLAESTGLILPMGKWVLKNACLQNKFWQKSGYKPIRIAVNVSALQLQQNDFINTVREVLEYTDMDPKFLEIEITESTLMSSIESNVEKLIMLKKMGIKISLDDFGTGYSSLSYLKKLPIDTLKIDKSFIDDIKNSVVDDGITGEIIQLAHKMKIDVIAEGVEKYEQVKFLKTQECDKIQGYVLSRPVPSNEVEKYLKFI